MIGLYSKFLSWCRFLVLLLVIYDKRSFFFREIHFRIFVFVDCRKCENDLWKRDGEKEKLWKKCKKEYKRMAMEIGDQFSKMKDKIVRLRKRRLLNSNVQAAKKNFRNVGCCTWKVKKGKFLVNVFKARIFMSYTKPEDERKGKMSLSQLKIREIKEERVKEF